MEAYRQDWQRLRAEHPTAIHIVAGDFNQDLALRHYYGASRQRTALEAALADGGFTPLTGGDHDPIARDSPPHACIDHICIAAPMAFHCSATHRWPDSPHPLKTLSDHFGVAVDVTFD